MVTYRWEKPVPEAVQHVDATTEAFLKMDPSLCSQRKDCQSLRLSRMYTVGMMPLALGRLKLKIM